MFTGIIEEVGLVHKVNQVKQTLQLIIQAHKIMSDIKLGDSIAIDGVCLTVTHFNKNDFTVDVMPETFKATTLSLLDVGSTVNLERALMVGGRIGGHFVTGHVDGVGKIIVKQPVENAVNYTIKVSNDILKYVIYKGSITIDGISLTIFGVTKSAIKVALIPHTMAHTSLGKKNIGTPVNIENDMLAKYVLQRTPPNVSANSNILDHIDWK